jgi:hypothetical protein
VLLRSRSWQLAAALVALCLLAIGGALWWRQRQQLTVAELFAALPSDSGALVFIDAGALREAGILDRLLGSRFAEEPEYKQFVEQSGFNYRTDLDRIAGRITAASKYFVVTGRLDFSKLAKYTEKNGGQCSGGYCTLQGSVPARVISFYPVRHDAMALAISPDGEAARRISRKGAGAAVMHVPEQPVWAEIPGAVFAGAESLPDGTRVFARALGESERVAFSIGTEAERFALSMEVTCKNAQDAAVLKAQLEGLTVTLKKMIEREGLKANPRDLSGVLTRGSFAREDRKVKARWPVEGAFLDALGS